MQIETAMPRVNVHRAMPYANDNALAGLQSVACSGKNNL